jgi:ADP-sugar diphosphatase
MFIRGNGHASTTFVDLDGTRVPVSCSAGLEGKYDLTAVTQATSFRQWLQRMASDGRFDLQDVEIQGVDMFGSRIGFIKLKANVKGPKGSPEAQALPGILFVRGGSVCVLIVLVTESGERFAVVTQQPRIGAADFAFSEIPAGMLDDEGHFAGKAAAEIQEETGLTIAADELIDLSGRVYGSKWPGVYMSPGGCDEAIRMFCVEKKMTLAEVQQMEGRAAGCADENEHITVRIVPLNDLWKLSPDAKTLCALYLYEKTVVNA